MLWEVVGSIPRVLQLPPTLPKRETNCANPSELMEDRRSFRVSVLLGGVFLPGLHRLNCRLEMWHLKWRRKRKKGKKK